MKFNKKLFLALSILLLVLFSGNFFTKARDLARVKGLKNENVSFDKLTLYFIEAANTKGAPYAFSLLKEASLPDNTDTHLLGHAVGDVLFRQKGKEGIFSCTHDFRNACSHSIVVGLFLEKGKAALQEIAEVCKAAPGGKGAYSMCFHGLGHGVLAHFNYDFEEAVANCGGLIHTRTTERSECVGGALMELISGGFHDTVSWERQRQKYLTSSDPLSPCNLDFVRDENKPVCFLYLTPYLMEVAGIDLGGEIEKDLLRAAFSYCNGETGEAREACFGGFGKEFVALIEGRDIRDISSLSSSQLKMIQEFCMLAEEGVFPCLQHAVNSLYWGGENDFAVAIDFCSLQSSLKEDCFRHLENAVFYFNTNKTYLEDFCQKLVQAGYGCLNI